MALSQRPNPVPGAGPRTAPSPRVPVLSTSAATASI